MRSLSQGSNTTTRAQAFPGDTQTDELPVNRTPFTAAGAPSHAFPTNPRGQVPPAERFQPIRVAREAGSGARDRLFMQKELRLLPGNRYFADAEMLLVAFRALGLNRCR